MKQEVCNPKLLQDVIIETKEKSQDIKDMVGFFLESIADTITEGAFETVLVPHFGKFRVKPKHLQYVMHKKGLPKQYNNGVIQDNGNTRSGVEQGVDLPDSPVLSTT